MCFGRIRGKATCLVEIASPVDNEYSVVLPIAIYLYHSALMTDQKQNQGVSTSGLALARATSALYPRMFDQVRSQSQVEAESYAIDLAEWRPQPKFGSRCGLSNWVPTSWPIIKRYDVQGSPTRLRIRPAAWKRLMNGMWKRYVSCVEKPCAYALY